jgi:hypothetical protein
MQLERWGIEAATSIVEAKVEEYGGILKDEAPSDIAAKLKRILRLKKKGKKK